MKQFLTLSFCLALCFSLAACTPEIKQAFSSEWSAAKEFNYTDFARNATGLKKAFPTATEKELAHENTLCMHEDAHDRVLSANGIDDEVHYVRCTLSPSNGVQYPQRMDGR